MAEVWTQPITWGLDDVQDATILNEQMRDNQEYLYRRPISYTRVSYGAETDLYPSLVGWTPLNAYDVIITTTSGRLEYHLDLSLTVAAGRVINFDVYFVEANVWLSSGTSTQLTNGATEAATNVAAIDVNPTVHGIVELAAGTYTCRLYMKASNTGISTQDFVMYMPIVKEV
jgi:hypothetical protein